MKMSMSSAIISSLFFVLCSVTAQAEFIRSPGGGSGRAPGPVSQSPGGGGVAITGNGCPAGQFVAAPGVCCPNGSKLTQAGLCASCPNGMGFGPDGKCYTICCSNEELEEGAGGLCIAGLGGQLGSTGGPCLTPNMIGD